MKDNGILEKYSFPVDNLEELCEIEKLIAADKAAFNKLIIAVASKGGQTLKESVWRMTFALFTNNLCCKLNWTGITRKDNESIFVKQSLKDLQCRHVLERAVKRNPATSSATEWDFQHEIVRFLRSASDRNGRQKIRLDQKNEQAKKKLFPSSNLSMALNKETFSSLFFLSTV